MYKARLILTFHFLLTTTTTPFPSPPLLLSPPFEVPPNLYPSAWSPFGISMSTTSKRKIPPTKQAMELLLANGFTAAAVHLMRPVDRNTIVLASQQSSRALKTAIAKVKAANPKPTPTPKNSKGTSYSLIPF